MAALVVLQAIAIGLLALLVGGLLRTHAEILRSLHRLGAGIGDGTEAAPQPVALSPTRAQPSAPAFDVAGTTPAGDPIRIPVRTAGHDTLVAFLSSGCFTCGEFWRAFGRSVDLPRGARLVIVTKGPAEESLSRVRELARARPPVVMSSEAWQDYAVPVTPFFVHVDGRSGQVVGQGAANTWAQVVGLFHSGAGSRTGPSVAELDAGVDGQLLAAGIHPGDPSLYPSKQDR